MYQYSSGNRFW